MAMKSGMKKMAAMKSGMKKSAMKAMKSTMKKAMKVSKTGRMWQVYKGTREKTRGGLKKSDLKMNKYGKIVSAKKSKVSSSSKWMQAVAKARKTLGVRGFQAVGGQTKEGQALLAKSRSFYKK